LAGDPTFADAILERLVQAPLVEGIERLTGFQRNGVSAGSVLPAPYRDVDVQRISEDLARRFLVVELDAKCENPEQRAFHEDFETSIKARRKELLGAVLTIWRWGRQTSLKRGMPLGSFEQWASWCRDPLLALGCVDPVQRSSDIKSEDPLRQQIFEFFQTWYMQHGSKPIKLRNVDSKVGALFGGSRQKLATFVRNLEGGPGRRIRFDHQKAGGKVGRCRLCSPPRGLTTAG
jgi:hypothetical protein